MLDGKEPNNLTDEQKAWPSVELDALLPPERFTMLEGKEPNNLTDEQKAWPSVELDGPPSAAGTEEEP